MSLQLEDIGPLRPTVVSDSLAAPPREDGMAVSGVSPEGVAIPELGVAPLADSETDLEDELPTPDDSPSMVDSDPERVCLPGVRPAPLDILDLELEKALLDVSILPVMVTSIVDPVGLLLGDSGVLKYGSNGGRQSYTRAPCMSEGSWIFKLGRSPTDSPMADTGRIRHLARLVLLGDSNSSSAERAWRNDTGPDETGDSIPSRD